MSAAVSLGLVLAALLQSEAAEPIACPPPADRPPDPRCGERLDGRVAPGPDPGTELARQLLRAPRLLSRAAFWPVVRTADLVETHELPGWYNAILTSDDGRVGVRPELRYATSFLPTGGARVFFRRLPGAGSELGARLHSGGRAAFRAEAWWLGPTRLGLQARFAWETRRDWLFAGIGAESDQLRAPEQGEARYWAAGPRIGLGWAQPLGKYLRLQLAGEVRRRRYDTRPVHGGPSVAARYGLPPESCIALGLAPGCIDPEALPGFEQGLTLVTAGASVGLDLRPQGRLGRGLELQLGARHAEGVAGDPSRHLHLHAETVLALGGLDRVLLLRLLAAMVRPLGRAPIPFEELVSPSGADGIRGLAEGWLRGPSGLVGTAEYRWYVSNRLDAALFADLGTVAGPEFSGLRQARRFPSVGFGLRWMARATPYWMAHPEQGIQLAYAPGEGVRVMFSLAAF